MPNWRASQSPQAWWSSSPILGDGVEDLSIDHSATASQTVLFNCSGCWIKGVRSVNSGRSHFWLWNSPRTTIRDSYMFGPGGGQQSYGIEPYPSSDTLIENNIFQNIAAAQTINGACSGCVATAAGGVK